MYLNEGHSSIIFAPGGQEAANRGSGAQRDREVRLWEVSLGRNVGESPKCATQGPGGIAGERRSAGSGAQFLLWNKRYDFVRGPTLSLLRCHKYGLNIEAIPGGKILADAPDFIDNGIPDHKLILP